MNTQKLTRKNYWSLDVAKFFCAILIISAHFASEWGNFPTIIDYAFSLYVIAVPFFFCCSGFLFFKKLNALQSKEEKKKYFIQYEKRIWIMYGLWSAVYFIHVVYGWVTKGFSFMKLLRYLHMAVVIQTYSTIWFLPALAIGIAVTYFLVTKFSKRQIIVISTLLYIFGMLGYTYYFVVENTPIGGFYDIYLIAFKTTRNGIFNAVPFIFMGYIIALKDEIIPSIKGFFKYAIPAGISLVLLIAEAFVLKLKFNVTGMDIGIFIVPFTYFFIMAVMHIDLKENKAWLWCRKLSLLIFLTQRLFLSMLPEFFPSIFEKIYANSYIGLVAVIGMTIAFSVIFVLLSNKVKFLKKMM